MSSYRPPHRIEFRGPPRPDRRTCAPPSQLYTGLGSPACSRGQGQLSPARSRHGCGPDNPKSIPIHLPQRQCCSLLAGRIILPSLTRLTHYGLSLAPSCHFPSVNQHNCARRLPHLPSTATALFLWLIAHLDIRQSLPLLHLSRLVCKAPSSWHQDLMVGRWSPGLGVPSSVSWRLTQSQPCPDFCQ